MNCPRCNAQNPEGSTFCNNCGLQLHPHMQNQNFQPQHNIQANQYQYGNINQGFQMNMPMKPPKIPFWKKTWFVVLMCIFFPPVGIALLWVARKPMNMIARIILTSFLCLYTLVLIVPTNNERKNVRDNVAEKREKKEETEEKKSKKEELKEEKGFIFEIEKYVDESVAKKSEDILKNQLGFSEIEFGSQLGETYNFEIWVDGTMAVITASDDVYRIFIPETDYVFYENGQIIMTAQQFKEKTMSTSEQSAYYIITQEIVKSSLKNPSSADFPSITFNPQDIAMKKSGDLVVVQSYVDAKNDFGAKVRTNYTVEFRVIDIDSFSYELVYANIDGNAMGAYIEI